LTLKNIELFSREVKPHLANLWDEDGWENKWWPTTLRANGKMATASRTSGAESRAGK
jgi:hypothetical protein